ncbi:MAG: hypothetical protein ACRC6V_19380 [Bacteroidales bacterium]
MELVTDQALLKELNSNFGASQGAPSYTQPEEEDEGSILDAAWEKVKLQGESLVASQVENPDMSNYARKRFKTQYDSWKSESDKLGMVGQVASEALAAAPAIGAYLSTPVTGGAGLAVGAGISGTQASTDALIAQYEQGQDFDIASAASAGLGSAGADLALGGIGNKLGGLIAKPTSSLARKAGGAAADIAVADAGSAVASQALINEASGQDITENLGTAALVGGVAGGAVRGASKIPSAIVDPGKALKNVMSPLTGDRTPNVDFQTKLSTHKESSDSGYEAMRNKDGDLDIDVPAYVETTSQGGKAAGIRAYERMSGNGANLTGNALKARISDNLGGPKIGEEIPRLGEEAFNMNVRDFGRGERAVNEAAVGSMFNRDAGTAEGLTRRMSEEQTQQAYFSSTQQLRGAFTTNRQNFINDLEANFESGKITKGDAAYDEYQTIIKGFGDLDELSTKVDTSKKSDVEEQVKAISAKIYKSAGKLDMLDKFVDADGKVGGFDIQGNMLELRATELIANEQLPGVKRTTPKEAPVKDKSNEDLFKTVLKSPFRAVGRLTRPNKRSRSRLKNEIQSQKDMMEALRKGDLNAATKGLEVDIPPANLPPRSGRTPLRTEEPIVEPTPVMDVEVEAPTRAPEPVVSDVTPETITGSGPAPRKKAPVEEPKKTPRGITALNRQSQSNTNKDLAKKFVGEDSESAAKAKWMEDEGGLSALEGRMEKAGIPGQKFDQYLNTKFSDFKGAKRTEAKESLKEAREAKAKKAEGTVSDLNENHWKRWTDENGVPADVAKAIRAEKSIEGKPLTDAKVSSMIAEAKRRMAAADKAKAAEAEADDKAMAAASLKIQKETINNLIKELKGVEASTAADLNLITVDLKAKGNAMKVDELNAMESDFISAIDKAINKAKSDFKVLKDPKAEASLNRLVKLKNKAQVQFNTTKHKIDKAEKAAKRATEASKDKPKGKAKDVEAVPEKAAKKGSEAGMDAEEIEKTFKNAKEDITEEEINKLIDKALKPEIEKLKKEFEAKFAKADEETLKSESEDLLDAIKSGETLNAEERAKKAALDSTDKQVTKVFSLVADTIANAKALRDQYPKMDRKLLMSRDVAEKIKGAMGGEPNTNSHYGRVWKSLRAEVFGDSDIDATKAQWEIDAGLERMKSGKPVKATIRKPFKDRVRK